MNTERQRQFIINVVFYALIIGLVLIGLHPLATLFFLYVGLKVIGFLGMQIFPTTLAVISSMKKEIQESGINHESIKEE